MLSVLIDKLVHKYFRKNKNIIIEEFENKKSSRISYGGEDMRKEVYQP